VEITDIQGNAAQLFIRLAKLDDAVFGRLSRYELALWRSSQADDFYPGRIALAKSQRTSAQATILAANERGGLTSNRQPWPVGAAAVNSA
jgi:hypothetical protein